MRVARLLLVLLALGPATAAAAEPLVAADFTERGRSLATALDLLLAPAEAVEGRVLWLVLDPSPSLLTADFASEFADAMTRNAARLRGTRIGVVRLGDEGPPLLSPIGDAGAIADAVRAALAETKDAFRNVYGDLRRLAGAFPAAEGPREIVLVTLENGDAEDEVEATAGLLARGGIRVSAIAREAFLSDTYWVNRAAQAPRGLDMAGGESAFIEVPWGWLFQPELVNEAVASGFAMYGLNRVVGATGGKVVLFYPPSSSASQCSRYGSCPFCGNDHIGCRESYQSHRLRALSPLAAARSEVFALAARDPYLQAVLRAWEQAEKKGLLRSRPSVRIAGGSLRPERRQAGDAAPLGQSLGLSGQASKAEELARDCAKIAADLEAETGRAAAAGGADRYRATAELTRVLLHVTRVNLLSFAAFCRDVAPELLARAKSGELDEPPETWSYPEDYRFTGISWTALPLCHGIGPFASLRLPGGEALDREIAALAPVVDGFLARHAHTPYAEAVRRSALARYWLAGVGRYVKPPDRTPAGSETDSASTGAKERPARAGPSGGAAGGATSGGGK